MFDRPAVNAVGKEHLLARDLVKGAPAKMDWKRADILLYIGFEVYLQAERFDVLPVKGPVFGLTTKDKFVWWHLARTWFA